MFGYEERRGNDSFAYSKMYHNNENLIYLNQPPSKKKKNLNNCFLVREISNADLERDKGI